MMKKFIAKVKYKGHISIMPVSGKNKEAVMEQVAAFYMDLFEEKRESFEIVLEERK